VLDECLGMSVRTIPLGRLANSELCKSAFVCFFFLFFGRFIHRAWRMDTSVDETLSS
jgi:hypothetical protein